MRLVRNINSWTLMPNTRNQSLPPPISHPPKNTKIHDLFLVEWIQRLRNVFIIIFFNSFVYEIYFLFPFWWRKNLWKIDLSYPSSAASRKILSLNEFICIQKRFKMIIANYAEIVLKMKQLLMVSSWNVFLSLRDSSLQ